jgi:endonuclease/exonuclease/phosphatase family metal-dependent hydrolase
MNKTLKKSLFLTSLLITTIAVSDFVAVYATHGKSGAVPLIPLDNETTNLEKDQIKVMTINMAHGRGDGKHQILQPDQVIINNIAATGRLIAKQGAQVVALQEADGPSWWSGDFSHVNTVAKLGGMTSAAQGLNVNGLGLGYGTAVISQLKASNARQVTFEKNMPTLSKGFVAVTNEWPGDPAFKFDAVSLHLDFANNNVRKKQLKALSEFIKTADKPVILMGDFNTDMSKDLLPKFLKETQLATWKANDDSIVTFPLLGTRIDWILVSPEFRIVEQTVLDDVLSDHKILTAGIERVQG